MREPVCSELALVLGHGQVIINAQVGEDFTLAHELWRLRREVLTLVKRSYDLTADRHQCWQRNSNRALKWSREGHQFGTFGLTVCRIRRWYGQTGFRAH